MSVSVGAHSCLILDIATPGVDQNFDQIFFGLYLTIFLARYFDPFFWRGIEEDHPEAIFQFAHFLRGM